MYRSGSTRMRGIVYITLGLILLLIALGPFLYNALAALAALFMINYGLQLRGEPPLLITLQRFMDDIRFHMFR